MRVWCEHSLMQLVAKTRDRRGPGRLAGGLLKLRLTDVVGLEECFEFGQPLMQRFFGGIIRELPGFVGPTRSHNVGIGYFC